MQARSGAIRIGCAHFLKKPPKKWLRFRKSHRAYFRGEYRNVSQDALVFIVAAVSYLVDPFDLIPDEVPFLGFLDDATVVAFAVARTRESLDDFMTWETTAL